MNSFREFFAILMAMLLFVEPMRAQQVTGQQSDEVSRAKQEAVRLKAAADAAEQAVQEAEKRQRAIDQANQEALQKANQRAKQIEQRPAEFKGLFRENPSLQNVEEKQVGDYKVQTYTRYESFMILPPSNGKSELSISVIRMGIQEAVRSPSAKEFAAEFRSATTREQQEAILKKYNQNVESLKAPESMFDPATFVCANDKQVFPPGFPVSPKTRDNPNGYTVITRFGTSPRTRMGPPVTDLETFRKQLPKAEQAIVERLPKHMDFRDRAEVAHILHQIAETGELDGLVAKEDYTKNYPYRKWSTGSGQPLEWVWFRPDSRGEQEKGIRIISRFTGRVYWINYSCGENIDEVAGCNGNMVLPGVYSTTVVENYLLCDSIEVVGKEISPSGVYFLKPGERITARVKPRPTGPAVRDPVEDWRWRINNKDLDSPFKTQVTIGYDDLSEKSTTALSVESRTPQGTVQKCSVNLEKFFSLEPPEIVCLSLTAIVVGDRVEVTVPTKGDASLIKRMEIRLDGKAIPDSELRRQNKRYSFDYKLVPQDGQNHVVTAALERSDGSFQECTDKTSGNTIPGRPIVCPECTATASRTKGIRDGQQDIHLRANIKNPGSLPVRNFRWTMRHPGVKDPVLLSEQEEFYLGIDKMPHDSAGKLISGTWIAVFSGEYQKPDGQWVKFSCPVELSVSKKGWNKGWLALLGLAVIPLLLSLGKKSRDPISQPGSIKPGTPAVGPSSIGNGVMIGIPIRIGASR